MFALSNGLYENVIQMSPFRIIDSNPKSKPAVFYTINYNTLKTSNASECLPHKKNQNNYDAIC